MLCACLQRGESSPRKQDLPKAGGAEEEAMADFDAEALAAKCNWQGAFTHKKKIFDRAINEIQAGGATTDQVVALLKKAQFLPQDVDDQEAKLTDINWRAVTGLIFEKDFDDWRIHPLRGNEIAETLGKCGIQIAAAARHRPNSLGEMILDCAWTEAMVRLEIDPSNTGLKALPSEIYWNIHIAWTPRIEAYEDIPDWNADTVANIIEAYATCTFLRANKGTRTDLRSILWAAILAEPRTAQALAKYCQDRGRQKDIPSHLLGNSAPGSSAPWINLGDNPFPHSEEEQEEPPRGNKEKAHTLPGQLRATTKPQNTHLKGNNPARRATRGNKPIRGPRAGRRREPGPSGRSKRPRPHGRILPRM